MSLIHMPVKGYLPDADMPDHIKAGLGPVTPFSVAHRTFVSMATSRAQAGTDYDIPNEPAVYDQLDIGACVLNAATGALNMILAVEGKPTEMLARLFLYFLCRSAMGTLDQDSGTYTHLAVERIGRIGICEERFWPYGDSTFLDANGHAVRPAPECWPEASDNRAKNWFNIQDPSNASQPSRLDQMEASIRADHPIIFGSSVDSAIQNYQAGQVLGIPNVNALIGGHSMVFTGIRYIDGQRCWRVRNSWGSAYGDNGHLLINDAWASWAALNDLWVITRSNQLLF
jgi:hypothetical protein